MEHATLPDAVRFTVTLPPSATDDADSVALMTGTVTVRFVVLLPTSALPFFVIVVIVTIPDEALANWLDKDIGGVHAIPVLLPVAIVPDVLPMEYRMSHVRLEFAVKLIVTGLFRFTDADDNVDCIAGIFSFSVAVVVPTVADPFFVTHVTVHAPLISFGIAEHNPHGTDQFAEYPTASATSPCAVPKEYVSVCVRFVAALETVIFRLLPITPTAGLKEIVDAGIFSVSVVVAVPIAVPPLYVVQVMVHVPLDSLEIADARLFGTVHIKLSPTLLAIVPEAFPKEYDNVCVKDADDRFVLIVTFSPIVALLDDTEGIDDLPMFAKTTFPEPDHDQGDGS